MPFAFLFAAFTLVLDLLHAVTRLASSVVGQFESARSRSSMSATISSSDQT